MLNLPYTRYISIVSNGDLSIVQTPCPFIMLHNVQLLLDHTHTLTESYFDPLEGGGIGTFVLENPAPLPTSAESISTA
jgi:hypothetical protein